MNKQIISRGLYTEGLRRTRITAFIFVAYIFLVQVIIPLLEGIDETNQGAFDQTGAAQIMAPLLVIPLLWVPIQTLVVFYVFDKRGSSDFYQSLPYTKLCLFFSWILSILTVTIGGLLAGTLAGYLTRMLFPDCWVVSTDGLGANLLMFLAAMLFALGAAMIAVSVTGTLLSNLACMVLIMFLPRLVMYIIKSMILTGLGSFLPDEYFLTGFGPQYNTFVNIVPRIFRGVFMGRAFYSYEETGAGPEIYTILVALIYIAVAAWLFQRRKSETAGNSAAGRKTQMVIRVAIAFAISLVGTGLSWLDFGDAMLVTGVFYVLAILVFFIYELLTTRSWKNMAKILPSLLIVVALNLLVVGGVAIARNTVLHKQVAAEDIKSVRFLEDLDGNYYQYIGQAVNRIKMESPAVTQATARAYQRELDGLNGTLQEKDALLYRQGSYEYRKTAAIETTKGILYRNIGFSEEELMQVSAETESNAAYSRALMTVPKPVSGTAAVRLRYANGALKMNDRDAEELLAVLQDEIEKIGSKNWCYYALGNGWQVDDDLGAATISYSTAGEGSMPVDLYISPVRLPDTFHKLMDVIWKNQDLDNLKEMFKTQINNLETDIAVRIKTGGIVNIGYGYHSAGDESTQEMAKLIEDALQSGLQPDETRYMIVNWWGGFIYDADPAADRSQWCLLPVPEGTRIDKYGQIQP